MFRTGIVDGPVPAPDSAVLEIEVVQAWIFPIHDRATGSHTSLRKERGEVSDVFFEEVEYAGDPALSEPHTWANTLIHQFVGASINGLREQRNARFVPQLVTGKQRRISTDCGLNTCDSL